MYPGLQRLFGALLLPRVILNTTKKQKMGVAWEASIPTVPTHQNRLVLCSSFVVLTNPQ